MSHRLRVASVGLLGLLAWSTLQAAPTTLTISNAIKGTSHIPVIMPFTVTRTGDLGFTAILNYHTVDRTALAGTDYTAASGQLVIPPNSASATIPITLLTNTGSAANTTFQVVLDSARGRAGVAPSFAAQQTFATGAAPVSVSVADVNGDGRPDIIVANQNDNTVSVSLNTTAPGATPPSFAAPQSFATGSGPVCVGVADVNGDGKPDLIAANDGDNTVSVLLNTTAPGATTPSFAAPQSFATGSAPVCVGVADVNGDGQSDIVVANEGSNSVSVLLNTTAPGAMSPSFAAPQSFATGSAPVCVGVVDVNGDGKADLIVANEGSNTVSVLLNTTAPGATTPSFAAQQSFATGNNPFSVGVADVNGDGKPDLIVANYGSNTVSVLLNTTAPGAAPPNFAAQQCFAAGNGPFWVSVADVNGDGQPDLIVANFADNTVSVLINTTAPGATTPSFAAPQSFATGNGAACVSVADVNGDGQPDLIVANNGDNTVSVLLNTTPPGATPPSFAAQQGFATGSYPASVSVADVNGDGQPDLIVANNGDNTVSVLLNTTAPGATPPSFAAPQSFATGNSPFSVSVADANGDGKPDIIVANADDNSVSVLLNTTALGATLPSFAAPQSFATGNNPFSVSVADVNGDGKADISVANYSSDTVSVLLNTTAPGATPPSFSAPQSFATGNSPFSVSVADVNGDGKADLIVANYGSNTVSVLLNTTAPGATLPSFAAPQSFATGNGSVCVGVADVNGDGHPDLIVANQYDNTVSVLLNTTAPGATPPSFAAPQSFATGSAPVCVGVADVNGDGKSDIVVANEGSNSVSVLLNTTAPGAMSPSFAAQQGFATGSYPASVSVADVNGDGQPDIVVANEGSNSVSVLLNTQSQALFAGSPATGIIVHDYLFADGFGD